MTIVVATTTRIAKEILSGGKDESVGCVAPEGIGTGPRCTYLASPVQSSSVQSPWFVASPPTASLEQSVKVQAACHLAFLSMPINCAMDPRRWFLSHFRDLSKPGNCATQQTRLARETLSIGNASVDPPLGSLRVPGKVLIMMQEKHNVALRFFSLFSDGM